MGTTGKADFKIEPLLLDSGFVLPLGHHQLCAGKITVTASLCSSPPALGLFFSMGVTSLTMVSHISTGANCNS